MNPHKRRHLAAGNWKMYKTHDETRAFFEAFLPLVADVTDTDIVVAPPYTSLCVAVDMAKGTNVGISAQNLDWRKEGAFTGEVSAQMLKDAGCRYVIIGHSERRQFFGETDSGVAQKTKAALDSGLTPIVCVGAQDHSRARGRDRLRRRIAGRPRRWADGSRAFSTIYRRPRFVDRRRVLPYSNCIRAGVGDWHR